MSNKSTDLVSRMRALSNSKAPWFDLEKLNALDLLNSAADEIERLQEFINSEFFKRVTYKQENDRLRTVLGGISACGSCEACRYVASSALTRP